MIRLIAAVDVNFGLSRKGKVPWHFSRDMDFFRQKTENSVVVMGKNTFFSIPNRPLKNRTNCVISTTLTPIDGVRIFKSFEDFMAEYNDDFWIIGGAHLYNHALEANLVNYALITQTHRDYHTDKFINASYLERFSKKIIFCGNEYSIIEYLNTVHH
ncbi:MAG: dihydrofolate reductase [Holosporaceae bacterium]|jgi:dihydrofolate reductase|nr:dihydrofolate reductase [Holosporaceae bacterium]